MIEFKVYSRWTGRVQFTAEIEADDDTLLNVKIGLAVKWAYKSGADLRDAVLRGADLSDADLSDAVLRGTDLRGTDLRGADLRGADLRGTDLRDADLSGAVLRGADLRGADLRGTDLRDADLSGADLSGAVLRGTDLRDADLSDAVLRGADLRGILKDVPLVPNIDAAILAAIEENKARGTNGLEMSSWHGESCNETNWCQTTHCRAGYAICLAGEAGFELERKFGPSMAGVLLYMKSTPDAPIPTFGASNEAAMADMKERAAKQLGHPRTAE